MAGEWTPLGLLSQEASLLMEGPGLRGCMQMGRRLRILQKKQEGLRAQSLAQSGPVGPELQS